MNMGNFDGEQNLHPAVLATIKEHQFQQGGNFDSEGDNLKKILIDREAGLLTEEQAREKMQKLGARRIQNDGTNETK